MVQNSAEEKEVRLVEMTITDEDLREKDWFWKDPLSKLNMWQEKHALTKGKGFSVSSGGEIGQML